MPVNYGLLGQKVKQKHPEYQHLPDDQVGQLVIKKYPEYANNPTFNTQAQNEQRVTIANRVNPYTPNTAQQAMLKLDSFTKGEALPNIGQTIAGVASIPATAPLSVANPNAGKLARAGIGTLGRVGGEVVRQGVQDLTKTTFEGDSVAQRAKNIISEIPNLQNARPYIKTPEQRANSPELENLKGLGSQAAKGATSELIGEFIIAPILNKITGVISAPVKKIFSKFSKEPAKELAQSEVETLTKNAGDIATKIEGLTEEFRKTGNKKLLEQISNLSDQSTALDLVLGNSSAQAFRNPKYIKPSMGEELYKSAFNVPRGLAKQVKPQETIKNAIKYGVEGSLEDIANASSTVTGGSGVITRMQRDALGVVQGDIEIPAVMTTAKQLLETSGEISDRDAEKILHNVYINMKPGKAPNTWNALDAFDAVQNWEKLAAQYRNAGYSVFNPKVRDQQIAKVYQEVAGEVKNQLDRVVIDQGTLGAVMTPDRIAELRSIGNGSIADEVLQAKNFTDLRHIASTFVNLGKMVQSTWDQQLTPFNRLVGALGSSSITGTLKKAAVDTAMSPQVKTTAGAALSKLGGGGIPGIDIPDLTPVGKMVGKFVGQQGGLKAAQILQQARQELEQAQTQGVIPPTPQMPNPGEVISPPNAIATDGQVLGANTEQDQQIPEILNQILQGGKDAAGMVGGFGEMMGENVQNRTTLIDDLLKKLPDNQQLMGSLEKIAPGIVNLIRDPKGETKKELSMLKDLQAQGVPLPSASLSGGQPIADKIANNPTISNILDNLDIPLPFAPGQTAPVGKVLKSFMQESPQDKVIREKIASGQSLTKDEVKRTNDKAISEMMNFVLSINGTPQEVKGVRKSPLTLSAKQMKAAESGESNHFFRELPSGTSRMTPNRVYRAVDSGDPNAVLGKGKYFVFDKANAKRYGSDIIDYDIKSNARVLDLSDPNELTKFTDDAVSELKDIIKKSGKVPSVEQFSDDIASQITKRAKKMGYDGIIGDDKAFGTVIWNEDVVSPVAKVVKGDVVNKYTGFESGVVKKYGITTDPDNAAFITKHGDLIKKSGRDMDSHASMVGGYGTESYLKETNSIRFTKSGNNIYIQTAKPITEKQKNILEKIVNKNRKSKLIVDYTPNQLDQLGRPIGGKLPKSGEFNTVSQAMNFIKENDKVARGAVNKVVKESGSEGVESLSTSASSYLRKDQPVLGKLLSDQADEITARERFDISNLKKLSSGGSDREVFDLGDGNVLKVAKKARGLDQMNADYYAADQGLIPQIKEQGKNYIVFEKVDKPNPATKQLVKNIKFAKDKFGINAHSSEILNEAASKYKEGSDEANLLYEMLNYNPLVGDVVNIRNWGSKDGVPIMLDEGSLSDNFIKPMKTSKGNIFKTGQFNANSPETNQLFRDIKSISNTLKKKFGDTDKYTTFEFLSALGLGGLVGSQAGKNKQEKQ